MVFFTNFTNFKEIYKFFCANEKRFLEAGKAGKRIEKLKKRTICYIFVCLVNILRAETDGHVIRLLKANQFVIVVRTQ